MPYVNGDRAAIYNTKTLASSFKSRRSDLSMHDYRTVGDQTLDSPMFGDTEATPKCQIEEEDLLYKL